VRSFRPLSAYPDLAPGKPEDWSTNDLGSVVDLVFSPGNFFLAPGIELAFERGQEEISWELFRGRLLDPAHSRVCKSFEAWNAYWVDNGKRSGEPILSVKQDAPSRQIHVVRAIHSYVWEGFDSGSNVIETRETTRWVRELVGTIHLDEFETGVEFLDELNCLLFQAVVGTSRLPLTSLENPLPAFTFGQLFYIQTKGSENCGPSRSIADLLRRISDQLLAHGEEVKLLEFALRAESNDQPAIVDLLGLRASSVGKAANGFSFWMHELFHEVSLSPYTNFADKVLRFAELLQEQGIWTTEERIDYLSWIIRHLVRHLTAYDLRTFHHRGANYPDALLLDAILKGYLQALETHPELFSSTSEDSYLVKRQRRRRRRAFRQAWLLRRWYEGLPVPEVPTSAGENRWVLPSSHVRIPEEHILEPERRTKRLFENDKLEDILGHHGKEILAQSIIDLEQPEELQELGMTIFLDRPLGTWKQPGEPDSTPLLSYQAFSRSIARARLRFLERIRLLKSEELNRLLESLDHLEILGIPISGLDKSSRPGVVSINDAARAAPDFVFLRTTKKSVIDFLKCFQFERLDSRVSFLQWPENAPRLIMRKFNLPGPDLRVSFYDSSMVERLQFVVDASQGFSLRAGMELPRAGLHLFRAWAEDGTQMTLPIAHIPAE
jgi:hypothetical protein